MTNRKTHVVINSKGGVGKSILAKYILPTLIYRKNNDANINVFEIDNSNKGNLNSKIIQHKTYSINEQNEAIIDVLFSETDENVYNIIDVGGDIDQVKSVLAALSESETKSLSFYIPANEDDEQFNNIADTINLAKENFQDADITLVLNRAIDSELDKAKEQFINIFGSEKYNFESRFEKIRDDIKNIAVIPQTNIFILLKNVYTISLVDMYASSIEIINNSTEYRDKWRAEAKEKNDKEIFFNYMRMFMFSKELVAFIEKVEKTIEV